MARRGDGIFSCADRVLTVPPQPTTLRCRMRRLSATVPRK